MRGRYPMSEQDEHQVADTPAQAARHASLADLLAFLGALVLAGALALLVNRTGQLSARLAFAGAAGLVAACVSGWRRLRRVELRRWRSGKVSYRGRRVTMVSAWGVEGQPAGVIEPPAGTSTVTPSTPTRDDVTTRPAILGTSGRRACTSAPISRRD
jgi:hypothetical protein